MPRRSELRLWRLILLLHNRYRWPGGEERAVDDLAWLVREHLGEDAEILERDSAGMSPARAAAGLLRGGLDAAQVASAVRRTGARVVHAHNVHPSLGWRALHAARDAGARVVLHLHNYRLVCAPGTCWTRGEDCVRCHGRNTSPGVRLNCRGSLPEAAAYAVGIARSQPRIADAVDAFVVPSAFALARLRELGAPVGERAVVVPSVQRDFEPRSRAKSGEFVLFAGRVSEEKGAADAVEACRMAGLPLVVAGDGPDLERLRATSPAGVTFTGRLRRGELDALRRRAAVAVVPSRYAEILPLAALEAAAGGLPVVAPRTGGLQEAVPEEGLVPPRDPGALGERLAALYGDEAAGDRALAHVRGMCAPQVVAARLREVYG